MTSSVYTTHISRWTYENESKKDNVDNYIRTTFPQFRDCVFHVRLDTKLNRYRVEFYKNGPDKPSVEPVLDPDRDLKAELRAKIKALEDQGAHEHHLEVKSQPFGLIAHSGPSPKYVAAAEKLAELEKPKPFKAFWEDQAVIDAIFGIDPTKYSPGAIARMRCFGVMVEYSQPRLE